MNLRYALQLVIGTIFAAICASSVHADDDASERIVDRIMVQLHVDEEHEDVTLEAFIAALESLPQYPGLTANVLDGIPSRKVYLIGLDAPEGVVIDDLEIDETFSLWLDEGEPVFEREAPEGTTGSTWIDSVEVNQPQYRLQYAEQLLGLAAAHQRSVGAGVVVAVLDTGIDVLHPEVAGAIAAGGIDFIDNDTNPAESANGLDDDGDGLTDEAYGHGTFVAGLVRLVAPEARILPIRILDDDGTGDSWALVKGVYYAIDRGVEVINLSLRSTVESSLLDEALEEAEDHGIVVVAAAGNLNRDNPQVWPAMDDKAIGVAAIDDGSVKASFSNFHQNLFISAPGASLPLRDWPGLPDPARSIIGAIPGGDYAIWEGTSMAVPLVSGAVALIRSQHPDAPLDDSMVSFVRAELAAGAVNIDDMNPGFAGKLGAGRLDVAATVMRHSVAPQVGDLNGDGYVGFADLLRVLEDWGLAHSAADLDGNGMVGFEDLLAVLQRFGP